MLFLLAMGLITAINYMVLVHKYEKRQIFSLIFDVGTLLFLSFVFMGTVQGMFVGMVAGAIISIWSLFKIKN